MLYILAFYSLWMAAGWALECKSWMIVCLYFSFLSLSLSLCLCLSLSLGISPYLSRLLLPCFLFIVMLLACKHFCQYFQQKYILPSGWLMHNVKPLSFFSNYLSPNAQELACPCWLLWQSWWAPPMAFAGQSAQRVQGFLQAEPNFLLADCFQGDPRFLTYFKSLLMYPRLVNYNCQSSRQVNTVLSISWYSALLQTDPLDPCSQNVFIDALHAQIEIN